ncbi:extracellular solute-binding protein [Elioraea sp.]|uniref:extracellular solute-binding protein n=1 Tax=Elioraea sp. TaxID=2185103 RepID=UPI0025C24B15|nr:extracellular solute-binding protein [Elioraea sp.]
MMFRPNRRRLLGLGTAAAAALAAPSLVRAQAREIVVGGPAGMAGLMRDEVIPPFERASGIRVLYEGSRSAVNLQKLQTQKDRPQLSVVMMDEDIMMRAGNEQLLTAAATAGVPEMGRIMPASIARDGLWIRYKTPRSAIAYNTRRVPGGIASWAAVWGPEFRGRLMVPHMSITSTVQLLCVAAHLATGKPFQEAQYEVDAGFRKLREIKPNVLGFYTAGQQAQTLLEQGEAFAVPAEISSYVLMRKSEGVPIDLNTPTEGSFALPSAIALVNRGPQQDGAQAFVNHMLTVPIQRLWATRLFDSPAHPGVDAGPGILPADRMFNMDWEFVSTNRPAWIQRFDREIAA